MSIMQKELSIEELIAELDRRIYSDEISDDDIKYADECFESFKKTLQDNGSNQARLNELNGILNYLTGNYGSAREYFSDSSSFFDGRIYFISDIAEEILLNPEYGSGKPKRNITRTVRRTAIALIIAWFVFAYWADSDQGVLMFADAAMISMADDAGMSDHGKAMFLRAKPEIVNATVIADMCQMDGSTFGCYLIDENKIYIRDLPAELYAMEVVTASHEMLHVARHRDGLTDEIVDGLHAARKANNENKELQDAIIPYSDLDGESLDDEIHAIIGTEIGSLNSSLMEYYSIYFDSRGKTLAHDKTIDTLFESKSKALEELSGTIDATIEDSKTYYSYHVSSARRGDRSNTEYYWTLYEQEITRARELYAQYESELDAYNLLAEQFNGKTFKEKNIELQVQQ